jgi:tRNA(adenine34) deaminase
MTRQDQIDIAFMQTALQLADTAAVCGEVPVGALVVVNGEIVARAHNQTRELHDPTAHAEVLALRAAAKHLKNHRLLDATLYVTIEPCLMCCGSLQHARIQRLVYGAREPRTGAVVSVNETLSDPNALTQISVTEGVLQKECAERMQAFFNARR